MKSIVLILGFLLFQQSLQAQVMFVERFEFESKYQEKDFMVMNRPGGLIAFRSQPERGFNLRTRLQLILTDFQLEVERFSEVLIKDNFDLAGYDLDGDYFYALFQKGSSATSDRYALEINLKTEEVNEILLEYVHAMDLQEFFVLNRKAVFLGISEMRPLVQILNIENNDLFTVQGVYSKDTNVLQIRKDTELGLIDVLLSKRDRLKDKQLTVFSFDDEGNKIREVNISNPNPRENEFTEGLLTPYFEYQQSILGTYGKKRREAYLGLYITDINQFGEYETKFYTMEDFPNFYSYLPEKQQERKLRSLERTLRKGKTPYITDVLSTREIVPMEDGFLLHNDHFIATNPRYIPRDGMYANDAYRFFPNRTLFHGPVSGYHYNPMFYSPRHPYSNWQQNGSYKFLSSYFIFIDREGRVIWDNAFNLENKTVDYPGKFGEIAYDGQKLHYLYLDWGKLKMSYMKNAEVIFENIPFDFELINESERIRDTQEQSLSLSWWYGDYFLLSGKQKIRFLNDQNREETRDVFFMTKIKVDGDLYVPDED
ncbi:MAG: transcriptional regulator [Mongoliibacter sp.]|uniref:transcriptional regulator n=1 Tax=Mongoliibacter sp. TaxID=2022438 RepID=UPI0012F40A32|nr:transcriptional regulator [Mongoliibacter sp.]TVP50684.1 MAG: transcriptional regulator [Mongoliibacter sp.]